MKNNKGFTLVELLAVIVILGVVLTIVVRSVIVSMDKAKEKTEKVFVSKLEDAIEQYIDLNKRSFVSNGKIGTIRKIVSSDQSIDDEDLPKVDVFKMQPSEGENFTFNHILSTGFIDESDLVNPAKEDVSCNKDAEIYIYRDIDFVYYFKLESKINCISTENLINTLPETYQSIQNIEKSGEDE